MNSLAWMKSLDLSQTILNYIRYCEICGREPLTEGFVVLTKGWYYCIDHEPEDHEHSTFELEEGDIENDCVG